MTPCSTDELSFRGSEENFPPSYLLESLLRFTHVVLQAKVAIRHLDQVGLPMITYLQVHLQQNVNQWSMTLMVNASTQKKRFPGQNMVKVLPCTLKVGNCMEEMNKNKVQLMDGVVMKANQGLIGSGSDDNENTHDVEDD